MLEADLVSVALAGHVVHDHDVVGDHVDDLRLDGCLRNGVQSVFAKQVGHVDALGFGNRLHRVLDLGVHAIAILGELIATLLHAE